MIDPQITATDLAQRLIGAVLRVRGVGGIVVETEAYGRDDPASHSFRGPTLRNAAMFCPAGHAYVYRSYGIHLCLNVVARPGEGVLIRALAPDTGIAAMVLRRGTVDLRQLCSGPGKLGQALGITLADNGQPFTDQTIDVQRCFDPCLDVGPVGDRPSDGQFSDELPLFLALSPAAHALVTGLRIGISRARDQPWRFGLAGSPWLSRPF